jgi:hypothetical protein
MMKKWMLILSIIGSLLLVSACSEEAVKETDDITEQTETETTDVVVEEDSIDLNGDVEYVEASLPDEEEYNRIFSIFLDNEMENSFRNLVGDDLDIFRVTFEQIFPVPTDDASLYAFHGYMTGLEGVAEGVVIFDESGKMWAATTEGENVNMYSNTQEDNKHHPIIEDWRGKYFSASSVVYKSEKSN